MAAVVGLVCATVGTAFAVPSTAHLVRAEPLGAVTTITATSSGTAEIVLYDDATISAAYTHNPDVTISGKGRLVGFDLSNADPNSFGSATDDVSAERLPTFAGGATYVTGMSGPPEKCSGYPNDTVPVQQQCGDCTYSPSSTVPLQANCTYAEPKFFTLHEGYYHLSVLTDGAPLRITIRLHGLGKTHANVHLQAKSRSIETTLPQQESIGSSTITFGAPVSFPSIDNVLLVVGVKLHASATVLADSACWRSDSAVAPPYAYSPACPGGHTTGVSYRVLLPATGAGAGGVGVFAGSLTPNGNPTGVGGSFVDSDGPTYVGGLAVWTDGMTLPYYAQGIRET
jgi:hypothetical protein